LHVNNRGIFPELADHLTAFATHPASENPLSRIAGLLSAEMRHPGREVDYTACGEKHMKVSQPRPKERMLKSLKYAMAKGYSQSIHVPE
jgi:hypothetical protein